MPTDPKLRRIEEEQKQTTKKIEDLGRKKQDNENRSLRTRQDFERAKNDLNKAQEILKKIETELHKFDEEEARLTSELATYTRKLADLNNEHRKQQERLSREAAA